MRSKNFNLNKIKISWKFQRTLLGPANKSRDRSKAKTKCLAILLKFRSMQKAITAKQWFKTTQLRKQQKDNLRRARCVAKTSAQSQV